MSYAFARITGDVECGEVVVSSTRELLTPIFFHSRSTMPLHFQALSDPECLLQEATSPHPQTLPTHLSKDNPETTDPHLQTLPSYPFLQGWS